MAWMRCQITEDDALQLAKLPSVHQDQFDRMLICQAIANQAVLVTPDPLIASLSGFGPVVSIAFVAEPSLSRHLGTGRVDAAC